MAGEKQAEAMSAAQVHAYKRGLELSSAQKIKQKNEKELKIERNISFCPFKQTEC
jgi:hypothetical protein